MHSLCSVKWLLGMTTAKASAAAHAAGQVMRLCMDPGGITAICCHSDGCIRMYDLETGHLRWRAWGHASHVAAAAVSPDLSRLVSVGGDGCVVVWKLPDSLVEQLQAAVAAVASAKEQAGSLPSPQQPPKQQAASPAAAGSSTSTPQGASHDAASIWPTPGSCMSDGAFSSTVRRLQQGKPLVSADKLPRWARSPTAASTAAVQKHASEGGAGLRQPQQQQQRVSKWLIGRQGLGVDGQCTAALSDPGVQLVQAQANAFTNSAAAAPAHLQELQAAAPWHRGHNRVLVTNWQDGSSFSREAAAMAATAAAAAAASQQVEEHEAPSQQGSYAAGQQADLPDKAQVSPAGQGEWQKRLEPWTCAACGRTPAAFCLQMPAQVSDWGQHLVIHTCPASCVLQVLWCGTYSSHISAVRSGRCRHTKHPESQQKMTALQHSRTGSHFLQSELIVLCSSPPRMDAQKMQSIVRIASTWFVHDHLFVDQLLAMDVWQRCTNLTANVSSKQARSVLLQVQAGAQQPVSGGQPSTRHGNTCEVP